MKEIWLSEREAAEVNSLLNEIFCGDDQIELDRFLQKARIYSDELPRRIREVFHEFKLLESSFGLCVRNNPINKSSIGQTPSNLPTDEQAAFATKEEVLHLLYGTLLGEVFVWKFQQQGHIINDIIPIRENSHKQISSGSKYFFELHTEDAFHEFRGEYFGLMCLRNPKRIPTTVSSITNIDLDPRVKRVLFESRFLIRPNYVVYDLDSREDDNKPEAILFGDRDSPYIRINALSTRPVANDEEAGFALDALLQALNRTMIDLVLDSGDCCYLDNFKAVHGRKPYSPEYDGTDRWMKRIVITNDLRRSRSLRSSTHSRIIYAR
jgi:L-asparagine oxygenase